MKNILAASAVAIAVLAGSASSSFAATYAVGNVSKSLTYNLGGMPGTVETGSFVDFYTFNLTKVAKLTRATITNAYADTTQFISNFMVALYKGPTATGTPIAVKSAADLGGFEFGAIQSSSLGTGNYVLKVSGSTTSASYGGSLAISVSTVPLPSTVALFGVALAGLGVAGAMRRKSAASAA